jgi:uncharacterized protein
MILQRVWTTTGSTDFPKMRRVMLDTSGLIAEVIQNEIHHQVAKQTMRELVQERALLVLHRGIEIELLDSLSSLHQRRLALQLLATLWQAQTDGHLERADLTNDLIDRGKALYTARQDKEWGLTDCISFVLMNELGIHEAFTLDHHFVQAGIVRLIPVA